MSGRVGFALLDGMPGKPEVVMEGLKVEAQVRIRALSEAIRVALLALVADAPLPRGRLDIAIERRITIRRMVQLALRPDTPEVAGETLRGTRVEIGYDPASNR